MATYTYVCRNLECDIYNIPFEVEMSMKEPNLTKCPDCNEKSLSKIIASAGGGFRIGGLGVHKPTAHWGRLMNRRTKKEYSTLLSSDSPIDFYYWISLLNFFDDHKDELNLKELKKVVDKCEECRLYLNHENTDPISQEDVNPNIYEYYRLQIENNKNNKDDDIELQFGLVEGNQKIFA